MEENTTTAAASTSATTTTDSDSIILETLRSRGWCLGDIDQLKAIIMIHSALADDMSTVVDSVESELTNMDLKSFGAKSLPDPTLPRKPSHILGPKVLQISSVRDIAKSTIEEFSHSSNSKRLLRLGLTDGHAEITAIEFSHIPSIPDDVVPGTKVRLENKAVVRNGIVCLNPKVLTLLGGLVQPLYEEWKMSQKYSGLSRSSLRLSQESGTGGPPPFEKLQIGAPSHRFAQQGKSSEYAESTSKSFGPNGARNTNIRPTGRQQNLDKATSAVNNPNAASITEREYTGSTSKSFGPNGARNSNIRPTGRQQNLDKATSVYNNPNAASITERGSAETTTEYTGSTSKSFGPNSVGNTNIRPTGKQRNLDKATSADNNPNAASITERAEENPSSSEIRAKEVVEYIPVQNQAAAQKLRQKMSNQNQDGRQYKGRKHRGKGKQEEEPVVYTLDEWEKGRGETKPVTRDGFHTLDEWEKGRGETKPVTRDGFPNISRDEDLAWQLQNQFDLEDSHVQRGSHEAGADNLLMSMFNYERDDDRSRGTGRGRGRGWGRGRGRGRGRRFG